MNIQLTRNQVFLFCYAVTGIIMLVAQFVFRVNCAWNVYFYGFSGSLIFEFLVKPYVSNLWVSFLRGMKNGFTEIAVANTVGFNMRTIAAKFGDHYAGIAACVHTAIHAQDAKAIGSELIKIGSFIGVEVPIINAITSGAAKIAANAIPVIEQQSLEDCIPLIASVATLTGKDITGIPFDTYVKRQSDNIRSAKIVYEELRKALEVSGIVLPRNFSLITEINESLVKLRGEYDYFLVTLATAGKELLSPEGIQRVNEFSKNLSAIDEKLRMINQPDIKNNKIFLDCQFLVIKGKDIVVQCKMIQSQRVRIKPVGICIQGPSGCGKSQMYEILKRKICAKIDELYIEDFGTAKNWQTWYAQYRDEFDTGYVGQQFTYMDDAFQLKDTSDHPMWLNFISCNPIGTVMAGEKEKGKPYNSLFAVTTCNVLPEKTTSIHHISALHERFPVTVKVDYAPGFNRKLLSEKEDIDFDFTHLKFKMGTMHDAIHNQVVETTFDGVVAEAVRRLKQNYDQYQCLVRKFMIPQSDDAPPFVFDYTRFNKSKYEDISEEEFDSDEDENEIIEEEEFCEEDEENSLGEISEEEEEVLSEEIYQKRRDELNKFIEQSQLSKAIKEEEERALEIAKMRERLPELVKLADDAVRKKYNLSVDARFSEEQFKIYSAVLQQFVSDEQDRMEEERRDTIKNKFKDKLVKLPKTIPLNNVQWNNNTQTYRYDRAMRDHLLRLFDAPVIVRPKDLGRWVYHLVRKADGKTFKEVIGEYEDTYSAHFLQALSLWEMPIQVDMQESLMENFGFKVVDHLGTEYIWTPHVLQGAYLFSTSDAFKEYLISENLPRFQRVSRRFRNYVYDIWTNDRNRRGIIRFAVAITAITVAPMEMGMFLSHTFLQAAMWRGFDVLNDIAENIDIAPPALRFHPIVRAQLFLIEKFEQVYVRLEASLKIFKDHTVNMFLSLCELLGLDVTPMLRDIGSVIGDVVLHTAILAIVSTILYLIYLLVKKILYPTKSIENQNKSEYDAQAKYKKSKRVEKKIRKIKFNSNTLKCEDCEKQEVRELLGDEFEFSHNKDDTNLYDGNFLRILDDYIDQDQVYIARILQVRRECALVTVHESTLDLDITENKILCNQRRRGPFNEELVLCIRFQMVSDDLEEDIKNLLNNYKDLNICDYFAEIVIKKSDRAYCDVTIYCLRAEKMGNKKIISKAQIATIRNFKGNFNKTKIIDEVVPAEAIMQQAFADGISVYHKIKSKHQVMCSKVPKEFLDHDRVGDRVFGIGHNNMIFTNAHFAAKGELIRFWKTQTTVNVLSDYHIAMVVGNDPVRDIAKCRILNLDEARRATGLSLYRMSMTNIVFPSIAEYLYTEKQLTTVLEHCEVLVNLPNTKVDVPATARLVGSQRYDVIREGKCERNLMQVNNLSINASLAKAGDCGGIVVNVGDRYSNKLVGFHAASGNNVWYAAFLTLEDVSDIEMQRETDDPWWKFIVPGKPEDLPDGEEVEFIGRYRYTTLPVSSDSIKHWHLSPFASEFEEQLLPSPLGPRDPRILVDLPTNQIGMPSLLIAENSKMCAKLPPIEQFVLSKIEKQMVDELAAKMRGKIRTVSQDMEQILHNALNGECNNIFVTNLRTNKASGIPWASLKDGSLKSDYLSNNDGVITFNEEKGQILKKRVIYKLTKSNEGQRVISFSNSKVKDAVIKRKAVEIGKVRVFHSIPVDKIIADCALFGNFKEAFQCLFLEANHAIGVNPHSKGWSQIYDKLTQHQNFFDCDFENYDKHLHAELMQTVFNIITKVIQIVAPDDWDTARQMLAKESIETYVVDFDTVYKTKRGNKSGEFLTTIVNCIANDILSFYTWIKSTGIDSIDEFRKNVSIVSFGDDKIEGVSDTYKDQYNYLVSKKFLTAIGHKITPGSKDGKESAFMPIDQLQFIKRTFKELNGVIVAPLLERSLESPFVWTTVLDHEFDIWKNIISEKLFEAVLHGEEYYDSFRKKLSRCSNPDLLREIASMISVDYQSKIQDYWLNCYKK